MSQEQLRQIVDTLRDRLQQELESQLSSLSEQQEQALEAARRAAASEAEARWAAKTESLKAEWTTRLDSEVSAARAEAERRSLAETARLRAEADQAMARVRAEAERAAEQLVARVRTEAEEVTAQAVAKLQGEVEQAAALAAVRVREEADQELETERQRNLAVLDAERARWSTDLDAERQRAAAMLDAERQRLDSERQAERQRLEADRIAERQRFDVDRQQFRTERQRFEADRQQFAVERQRFQATSQEDPEARARAEQLGADVKRLESELGAERQRAEAERQRAEAERQQVQQVQEGLQQANAALARVQQVLEEERQARAADQLARARAEAVLAENANLTATQEAERDSELAILERLADAMGRIDEARSLTAIMTTLVEAAGAEAPRAALFIANGNRMQGFMARGFSSDIRLVQIEGDRLFDEAIERGATVATGEDDDISAPTFASLPHDRAALAVPVLIGGEAVAMLYADDGTLEDASEAPASWPEAVEILTSHAAVSLAHLTATRTAEAMQLMEGSSSSDEESSAKRYARLLVSEIKLYNEAAVRAGREHRDLMTRLRPEIERARRLYEDRVPATAGHREFFREELVQTLAEGDAALLG